jgi:hypothetical protein
MTVPDQEPTVEGKTFDQWVDEYQLVTTRMIAVEMARLLFGLGGDTPVIDVTQEERDTEAKAARE